jgi:acyl carrier protein
MSNSTEVFNKVVDIISQHLEIVNREKISMETTFQQDLNADSLDLVEIIMALEEEFELEIPDEAAEKMSTIGDVIRYVENNKVSA